MNDYLSDENIVLIEWANKINSLLPSNTIYLNFSHQEINKRKISIK